MARIPEEHKARLTANLPPADETIARARHYMQVADLSIPAFAKLVGYGTSSVHQFLLGKYTEHRGDLLIRQAVETTMQRFPVGVASTRSGGRLYETENVVQIKQIFEQTQQRKGLAFIYGPPGSQKSFVLQHVIAEFNRRELAQDASVNRAYLVYASVDISPRDLLIKICKEIGAHVGVTLQQCLSGIRQKIRGTNTIIVVDEAQHCRIPVMEALRELHDIDELAILLAGSHELKKFFDTRAAELEQWNSRLDAGIELSGVSDKCARAILAVECPELDAESIEEFIADSKVADVYSRSAGNKYLSVRRLFKSIAGVQRMLAQTNTQEAA